MKKFRGLYDSFIEFLDILYYDCYAEQIRLKIRNYSTLNGNSFRRVIHENSTLLSSLPAHSKYIFSAFENRSKVLDLPFLEFVHLFTVEIL